MADAPEEKPPETTPPDDETEDLVLPEADTGVTPRFPSSLTPQFPKEKSSGSLPGGPALPDAPTDTAPPGFYEPVKRSSRGKASAVTGGPPLPDASTDTAPLGYPSSVESETELKPRWPVYRLSTLAALLAILFGSYYYVRFHVYDRMLYTVAQAAIDYIGDAKVEKLGNVSLDRQGDMYIMDSELYTDQRGERRLFFKTKKLILAFDDFPLPGRKLRIMRIDMMKPEIFVVRWPDGDWNVLHAFIPQTDGKKKPEEAVGDGPDIPIHRDRFPPNGVHIHDGTLHVVFVDSAGEEVVWRVDNVDGKIVSDGKAIHYEPFRGDFYGGRIEVLRAICPHGPAFKLDLQVDIQNADVRRMCEGAPFLEKPVTGRFDAFISCKTDEAVSVDPVVAGWARIKEGDLWEFPALTGVLSALTLRSVTNRKITGGEIRFTQKENRIRIDQLDLQGTPLCLYGEGFVDLTGKNLEITFAPSMTSAPLGIPLIGPLLDIALGNLVPITVGGSWADAKGKVEKDRKVSESLKKLYERKKTPIMDRK